MTLEAAKQLDSVFGSRELESINAELPLRLIVKNGQRYVLVFNRSLTKSILLSKCFSAFDYYKPGTEKLRNSGIPCEELSKFWEHTPLFLEGLEHKKTKLYFHKRLEALNGFLLDKQSTVDRFIAKRKRMLRTPLDFSRAVTRILFAFLIVELTGIGHRKILRALDMRCNVFFGYFHAPRHKSIAALFEWLFHENSGNDESCSQDRLLAQSFLVMGADPIMASICGAIVSGSKSFSESVYRIPPVSFVTRICTSHFSCDGWDFYKGDLVNLSLLPNWDELINEDDKNLSNSITFALGTHKCIGENISLTILNMAQIIFENNYPEGFPEESRIAPDGTFLAFGN